MWSGNRAVVARRLPGEAGGTARAPRPVPKLSPDEPRAISPTSRALAHKLARVDVVALGGISNPGVMSLGEERTLALSREPNAIEAFTWLGNSPRQRRVFTLTGRSVRSPRIAPLRSRIGCGRSAATSKHSQDAWYPPTL
jgi:hypothetical protein